MISTKITYVPPAASKLAFEKAQELMAFPKLSIFCRRVEMFLSFIGLTGGEVSDEGCGNKCVIKFLIYFLGLIIFSRCSISSSSTFPDP